jgi:hypothetical protein
MQIYHTSHCGSTLLISLLSEVIPSYSEPSWSHEIYGSIDINFQEKIKEYNNCIIKLPSALCHYAVQTQSKKVFLYRNLKNHLFKLILLNNDPDHYINWYYDYFLQNIHPNLKGIDFNTSGKKHVFLWANRIFWMSESQNCYTINANHFFSNKKQCLSDICNFLNIKEVKNFFHQEYNVKEIGMNRNEIELSKVIPSKKNAQVAYPSYGIIEDAVCLQYEKIMELVNWTKDNIDIPEFLL